MADFKPGLDHVRVGYGGTGNAADVATWLQGAHAGAGFAFADVDTDGNGQSDAVAVTGGSLGLETVVLGDWTVAALVGQGYLTADHHVKGDWIA